MISLIYGGSGSGKSEYAESLVLAQADPGSRYYIATMRAYGEEGRQRVLRHQKLRAGKGFQTIEQPWEIERALEEITEPASATILLECVSNLVANEMFDRPAQTAREEPDMVAGTDADDFIERIVQELSALLSEVKHAVVVTNNIFEDGAEYDELMIRYMESLAAINCHLAEMADHVTEVVAGIPITIR